MCHVKPPLSMDMLREVQGVHAPLKLRMERVAVTKAMTRLPYLHLTLLWMCWMDSMILYLLVTFMEIVLTAK